MMSEGGAKVEAGPHPFHSSSSIYNKSSLPYLLSQYGFEDKETTELRKKKEERKRQQKLLRKQTKKSESFDAYEDEKDLEREKEREQHYEQMIKDLHKLRDYYYMEYSTMLSEKVERQRKEQKDRDLEMQKQREMEEEEARKATHRVKKRLERHTLATTPTTDNVPKTDLYRIVGLENKLRREGKLRTMSDYNKFRQAIAQPHVFNHYFKNKFGGPDPPKSYASTDHGSSYRDSSEVFPLAPEPDIEEMLTGSRQPRSLSRISESKEASRPGTRTENWAITQQYPALQKSRKSIGQIGKQKSEYKQDLDKRFPKLEMPKLHCFTMNLEKKPPDPEEVRQQMELRAKEKQRKRTVRTYTKMYQLAMSNAAASARIFDMHDDMDMLMSGPDLCDVIADNHWMEAYGLRADPEFQEDPFDQEFSPQPPALPEIGEGDETGERTAVSRERSHDSASSFVDQQMGGGTDEEEREGKVVRSCTLSSKAGSSKKGSAKSKRSAASDKTKSPLPLTMDEIQGGCSIMEAKTLSTLWTNYLQAGKP